MLKVGITGGIGSGKTIVARVFETLGVPLYNADSATKQLMEDDESLRKEIIALFGEESYSGKKLNRKFIASQVFGDEKQLEKLNAITHPATIRHAEQWMEQQVGPYAIKEAALLFESGSYRSLDFIIGVSAPESIRISRTIKRDQVSEEEVRLRMQRQMPEDEKMKRCDAIIYNDEQLMVIPQVLSLHENLLKLASGHMPINTLK